MSATLQKSAFAKISARFLSEQAKKAIDDAVTKNSLVLFMKGTPDFPQCGFSRAVVQVLQVQGADFSKLKTYNILEDEELRNGIKEYSNWPTIPQLYVKGEFVGGCDIVIGMHQSGELEQLLEKEKLLLPLDNAPSSPSPSSNA